MMRLHRTRLGVKEPADYCSRGERSTVCFFMKFWRKQMLEKNRGWYWFMVLMINHEGTKVPR